MIWLALRHVEGRLGIEDARVTLHSSVNGIIENDLSREINLIPGCLTSDAFPETESPSKSDAAPRLRAGFIRRDCVRRRNPKISFAAPETDFQAPTELGPLPSRWRRER